ncbi:H-2 class II histocompatibility I-E beta chain-like protein [Labeo rohita]|uniref:H-2 class II histocompatibility I-E beta chain-like protein n=1 Tax=Labeo rohita TaxID=84645 RepID=A0A498LJT9_LABRO|nr:H-2 class II histocompatibility I-E beta chain-like protein [Labeo rohita]
MKEKGKGEMVGIGACVVSGGRLMLGTAPGAEEIEGKRGVKPKVKISSVTRAGGRHPPVLMCSAYEFYPPHIKVSWLRDGKLMTSEVTSTMEMADGDWYYQIHSELEYSPKSGEKISCMVEHASFNKHPPTVIF